MVSVQSRWRGRSGVRSWGCLKARSAPPAQSSIRGRHPVPGLILALTPALLLIGLIGILGVVGSTGPAQAETRIYNAVTVDLAHANRSLPIRSVALFAKQESRFRREGLVLTKSFLGTQVTSAPWLASRLYYANKDQAGDPHRNRHLLSAEILLRAHLGRIALLDRSGNEWHISDRFYRYRNYLELAGPFLWGRLSPWASEEWRFDSDQGRINLNDNRIGLTARIKPAVKLRVFGDLEQKRRGKPGWQRTIFLGLALGVRA